MRQTLISFLNQPFFGFSYLLYKLSLLPRLYMYSRKLKDLKSFFKLPKGKKLTYIHTHTHTHILDKSTIRLGGHSREVSHS
jgi:hypothetical protein